MAQIAYSIQEACVAANIGRTTLYAAIRDGALKARKLRRRTVILHDDLASFLDALPLVRYEGLTGAPSPPK